MTIVRAMVPADYQAVAEISAEAAGRALVGLPFWVTEAEVAAQVATLGHSEFVVAEDETGTVVGVAGYDLKHDGEARLYGPLVTTAGLGIGAFLSSRIEAMARDKGAVAYSMLVGLANKGGAAWAQWHGYHLDTEQPELLFAWLHPGQLRQDVPGTDAIVRPATPADLDRIIELHEECFPVVAISRQVWQNWLPQLRVAEQAAAVAGFLRLEIATGFLHQVCVAQGARRRGLGARLVTEAILTHWEKGPTRIGLTVRLDNTAAVALFRRLGFRHEVAVARWVKREG